MKGGSALTSNVQRWCSINYHSMFVHGKYAKFITALLNTS